MKELIWVRVQYASRQQYCKTHKRPLPFTFLHNGYRVSVPGVKRPRCEVDHPLPSRADFKGIAESYIYCLLELHGLFKDDLYLYLYLLNCDL